MDTKSQAEKEAHYKNALVYVEFKQGRKILKKANPRMEALIFNLFDITTPAVLMQMKSELKKGNTFRVDAPPNQHFLMKPLHGHSQYY